MAGLTLSRNRGGLYIRARANPVNPASAEQTAVRTIFGNLSTRWQSLTDDQREAWTTYAINVTVTNSLGEQITLTGHQMYIRNNSARMQVGLSPVDDGPIIFASDVLSPVACSVATADDAISVTFEATDDWVGDSDGGLLVYSSRSVSPTINFFKGPYRAAGIILGDDTTPPTSPDATLTAMFTASVANNTGFRVLSVRGDGRISPVQFVGPNGNV
jgi:hypothetical protein